MFPPDAICLFAIIFMTTYNISLRAALSTTVSNRKETSEESRADVLGAYTPNANLDCYLRMIKLFCEKTLLRPRG